ncbi:MAG: amylo-alpha-1,6-glucosidase [Actinomycetota bacterium]
MARTASIDPMSSVPDGFEVDLEATRLFNEQTTFVLTDQTLSLLATKEGDMFLYADHEGNLCGGELGMGLYFRDTRFLSQYEMEIGGHSPILLSSSAERAYMSYVDLTNPDLDLGESVVAAQTLNIRRTRVIKDRLFERIRFKNYSSQRVRIPVTFRFGSDFADIFHVRGHVTERSGTFFKPRIEGCVLTLGHLGVDGEFRRTRIDFGVEPESVDIGVGTAEVAFKVDLVGGQSRQLTFTVEPLVGDVEPEPLMFDVAVHELRRSYDAWDHECTTIHTDNELFNTLLQRGRRDLRALLTETPDGRYIAAGIPWYVAAFGRDSVITAHQILMLNTTPARDTLRLLARFQGDRVDEWRDEEPGRILHEIRTGALANAGVVPHTPYYGSIDSTPLFLMLFGTYFKWTNDRAFAAEMMPHVERALRWIDEYGDADGDGFVEYQKRSSRGLDNQGWKDSWDAVLHADGAVAKGPIALAEVQAYVHLAKHRIADVYEALGRDADAAALRAQALELKARFNKVFWNPEEQYYALALDGDKRPVGAVTSNPAHGLYCHILDADKAAEVAKRLLQPDMFTGWGIRTLSKSDPGYNPMSYHNGSVWPHDNALIAAGLKRYGYHKQTNRISTAIFDAAVLVEYMRLPELFCGFTRRTPNQPVAYPVACSPQAWAAGSPFLLLQSMLGLSAQAPNNLLTINSPMLPPWLNWVELRNLRVGDALISLIFRREGETTSFSLLSKLGSLRVVMEE